MFVAYTSPDRARIAERTDVWRRWASGPNRHLWLGESFAVRSSQPICGSGQADDVVIAGRARVPSGRGQPGARPDEQRDIAVVYQAWTDRGLDGISRLTGAFAVVVWHPASRVLYAIRDALGLFPMYYAMHGEALSLADTPDELDAVRDVDAEFVADFIATGQPHPTRTIWRQISAVPAGTILSWRANRATLKKYWSAHPRPESVCDIREAAQSFRSLLEASVAEHLDEQGRTWAHLSGGHDSSSIAAVAARHSERGDGRCLGGTLTLVDRLGIDETPFVDHFLKMYPVRNERVVDYAPWRDDGEPPPRTPLPTRDYPFYARDRQIATLLKRHGATAVLSGIGPDEYLPFTGAHATALFWTGQSRKSIRLVFELSVAGDGRFWRVLPVQLLGPAVPLAVQRWHAQRRLQPPRWLRADFARESRYAVHATAPLLNHARPWHVVQARIAARLERIGAGIQGWRLYQDIEVRHPFLYRPLVDLCLALPYEARMDPRTPKPVLRVAMKGIVPDQILARRAKGTIIMPRVRLAFGRQRPLMRRLLASSMLADLGVLDPRLAMEATDTAAKGRDDILDTQLYYALSLETWLTVRFGKYPEGPPR